MLYVLDTNTLIYFFKGNREVADRLLSVPKSQVGVPAIVVYEIETGIAKSPNQRPRREQFDLFLSNVATIPFGDPEAKAAAAIRADLEKQGTPMGPYDVLIAGTALAQNGAIVTHNTKEFSRVKGLRVEDWWTTA